MSGNPEEGEQELDFYVLRDPWVRKDRLNHLAAAFGLEHTSLDDLIEVLDKEARKKGFKSLRDYMIHVKNTRAEKLAEIIRIRLEELGKTQNQLAEESHAGLSTISFYLSGKASPKEEVLNKIYSALDLESKSIDKLYEDLLERAKEKGCNSLQEYMEYLKEAKKQKKESRKQKLAEIITTRLAELGKSIAQLGRETNLRLNMLNQYTHAKTFPKEETLGIILAGLSYESRSVDRIYAELEQTARENGFDSLKEYRDHFRKPRRRGPKPKGPEYYDKTKKLAEIITTRLAELGKTQSQLSREMGLSSSSLYHYTNAKVLPREKNLGKLLSALGLESKPIDEIYAELEQTARDNGYPNLIEYRKGLASKHQL
jgi:transcriptional regulator with XRE-family HTH domain